MIKSLVDSARQDSSLRPYQVEGKVRIYEAWHSVRSVLFQMPTGTGKTRLFASIIKDIRNVSVQKKIIPQPRILILAHRTELINQIYDTLLQKYRIICGVIKSGVEETPDAIVQVASVQSLSRRMERWKDFPFRYIIIDEAHHALAKTYSKICKTFLAAKILGVTATPCRLNRESFRKLFDKLIISPSVQHFIDAGYLCPIKYYSIKPNNALQEEIDSIEEFGANGDYAEDELMDICDKAKIRAQLIKSYKEYALGKKGIVYTINKVHNKHIAEQYQKIGVRVAVIDSKTPESERKRIVRDFKRNAIDIICNVNIFSEGFDCPDIDFIQLARPTLSLSLYLQQVGRAMRKAESKECALILDNVGLYNKFGLPNIDRNWERYFNGFGFQESEKMKRKAQLKKTKRKPEEIKEADDDMLLIETMGNLEDAELLCDDEKNNIYDILATCQQFPIGVRKYVDDLEQSRWQVAEIEADSNELQCPIADKYTSLEDYVQSRYEYEIDLLEQDNNKIEVFNRLIESTYLYSVNGKYGVCRLKDPYKISDVHKAVKKSSTIKASEYFEVLLEPIYDKIGVPNSNDVFLAVKKGKWGAVNGVDLTSIIPFAYDALYELPTFFIGYLACKNGKSGVLDHNGKEILPFEFDAVYPNMSPGLYVCERDGKYIIALNGKFIKNLMNTQVCKLTEKLYVYSLRKRDRSVLFLADVDGNIVFPYGATDIFLTKNKNEICLEFTSKHILIDFDLAIKTPMIEGLCPAKLRRKKKKLN